MDKSNFQMCKEIMDYELKEYGRINQKEVEDIKNIFKIINRTNIELQNLRDFVVMYFSKNVSKYDIVKEKEKVRTMMDKMSAICAVIDEEKWNRGMPV